MDYSRVNLSSLRPTLLCPGVTDTELGATMHNKKTLSDALGPVPTHVHVRA